MLPNLRLVVAAMFSTLTLAFCFGLYASFRLAHDAMVHLPGGGDPSFRQIGFSADEFPARLSLSWPMPEIFRAPPQAVSIAAATGEAEPAVAAANDLPDTGRSDVVASIVPPANAATAKAAVPAEATKSARIIAKRLAKARAAARRAAAEKKRAQLRRIAARAAARRAAAAMVITPAARNPTANTLSATNAEGAGLFSFLFR